MGIYYANEIDEHLAHYGVKDMKWGKHVMARDPDYLRRIRDALVEKKLRKKKKQLSDPERIKRAKQKNRTALYGIVKGGKAGYEKRKRRRKKTYQIKKSLTTARNKARRYIKSIMNNAF